MQDLLNFLKTSTLESLNEKFGVEHTLSKCEKLVILNYSQINSRKNCSVADVCRGLCLELPSLNVVAKSFNRFYNYGESESQKNFNWNNFTTQEKLDGSLLKIYNYNDKWSIQTRGSFADGLINGSEYTWENLFFPFVKNLNKVPANLTLVCEGTSVYNKVVRHYGEPSVSLLTAFNNNTLQELSIEEADELAALTELKRPALYQFSCPNECRDYLDNLQDFTFEGFVFRDCDNKRIKIKNRNYLMLHRTVNNHNLKNEDFLNLILDNEYDEFLSIFPEYREKIYVIKYKFENIKSESLNYYESIKFIENQKEYAIEANKTRYSHLLFNLRKNGGNWKDVEKNNKKLLLSYFN